MKRKSINFLLTACMALGCFTGCAEESGEVDYNLDSSEGTSTGEGVIGTTLAQFANEETWTESFTVTKADGQTMEVQIDAEIRIPAVDHMSVMEVKVPVLDYSVTEEMAYPVKEEFTSYGAGQEINVDWQSQYISFYPEDRGALHAPEDKRNEFLRYYSYKDGWEDSPGNQCSLSVEEAEEIAADFLGKMGISISYYQIAEQTSLFWTNEAYSSNPFMEDGYHFEYVLKDDLGNDLITNLDNYKCIETKFSGTSYELNPAISINLVDEGVLSVSLGNVVEVVSITPVQNYMSFESIKQSLRQVLSEEFDKVYIPRSYISVDDYEELILNSAELTYFRIRDKERSDYYSYIPVWRFCHQTETGGEIIDDTVYNPILINALDGSVIYLEDEL